MEIEKKIQIVKESIGSDAVDTLNVLFRAMVGHPPRIDATRFRADHPELIESLDWLEFTHSLIQRDDRHTKYSIRPYALPLVDSDRARTILALMEEIFQRLKLLYKDYLSEPVTIPIISKTINSNQYAIKEALYYLAESHGVWLGKSTGFPYVENAKVQISERVLLRKSIIDILSDYYDWHYVNPRVEVESSEHPCAVSDMVGEYKTTKYSIEDDWINKLDDVKKALLKEVKSSLDNKLKALPTMGMRTLIETVMVEKVGDFGSFRRTLEKFKNEEYVTGKHAEIISRVLDAGNAAAHRAYFPNDDDLDTCFHAIKHLIEGVYVLHPKVVKVAKNTPNRKN